MNAQRRYQALLACFALSGMAGLIYQTLWTRQFSLIFGTTELALITVLAAYMGGLAAGAALADRWLPRVRRPVRIYAYLELAIGLAALLVPLAIVGIGELQVVLLSDQNSTLSSSNGSLNLLYYALSSFMVLIVPTAMMGATLPLLIRWAVTDDSLVSARVGTLYAINTMGAALGTLAAAFVLFPLLGTTWSIMVAVALNVIAFALAWICFRKQASPTQIGHHRPTVHVPFSPILIVMMISGGVAFSWEILWTRVLSQVLGSTLFGFATMLSSFLLGIALGALLASRLWSDRSMARRGLIIAQCSVASFSLIGLLVLDQLVGQQWLQANRLGIDFILCMVTLFPGALAMGATFPLAVRLQTATAEQSSSATAKTLAWNTLGAIVGLILTGYFLLPTLAYSTTALLLSAMSVAMAVVVSGRVGFARTAWAGLAASGVMSLALIVDVTPWQALRFSSIANAVTDDEISYFAVGRSANVMLTRTHAGWRLTTNGLPESSIEPSWGRAGRSVVARWLSALPVTLRPEAESMLVIGLGAGTSVEDIPGDIQSVNVIEIEERVVAANRSASAQRWRDPLSDSRVHVHVGDARGALRLSQQTFDIIVSQPSHPWTSGASQLYTREFFELCHGRLNDNGLFVQWMALGFTDQDLFKSLIATLNEVFMYVEVYQPTAQAVVLVAGDSNERGLSMQAFETAADTWKRLGIHSADQLQAMRLLDAKNSRHLSIDARLIEDAHNRFEVALPGRLEATLGPAQLARITQEYDDAKRQVSRLPSRDNRLQLIHTVHRVGLVHRARHLVKTLPSASEKLAANAIIAPHRARAAFDLERANELAPGWSLLTDLMLMQHQQSISTGAVPRLFLPPNRFQQTMIDAWRRANVGDWNAVRSLDEALDQIDIRSPLFQAATRIRIRWRLASGETKSLDEALQLLDLLLTPNAGISDLLLQMEAGLISDRLPVAHAAALEARNKGKSYGVETQVTERIRRILSQQQTAPTRDE